MAIKQLKDLIDWITEYHEALENQYGQLANSQEDERIRMALQFLASREHRMAEGMEDFLQDAEDDLMDSWLVDSQDFDPRRITNSLPPCNGCRNIQDVLGNILQSHETLTEMYALRSHLAQNPGKQNCSKSLPTTSRPKHDCNPGISADWKCTDDRPCLWRQAPGAGTHRFWHASAPEAAPDDTREVPPHSDTGK